MARGPALPGREDLGLGLGPADPGRALDRLAGLEVLVDLEEVLDLQPVVLRHVVDVAQVLPPRVGRGHAEDLVVAAGLVGHPEHPERAGLDQAAGEGRLLQQHQRVQRVAVEAEGLLDEPVVGRVARRGEQHPVQPEPAGLVVDLVLVAVAPWGSRSGRRTPPTASSNVAAACPVDSVPYAGPERPIEVR